jgi:succinyl-diaminopimelate desuccinylase
MNINSVPDRAEIGIDIRTVPGQDHAALGRGLSGYLGDGVAIETLIDVAGVWTDPKDAWLQQVFAIMAAILGEPIETRTATYFTDASALTPAYGGPPTVILGPGRPELAHQTDEYCEIARIEQAVEAYRAIALAWADG